MKIVKVQAPDGTIIKVEGPDNATDEQFIQEGIRLYQQQSQAKNMPPPGIPRPALPEGLQPSRFPENRGDAAVIDRLIGAGQSIGNTVSAGIGALPGMPATPRFEPSNPDQAYGQDMGQMGQYAALGLASGGMSLPAQVALGGLGGATIAAGANQDPRVAGGVGMGLPIAGAAFQGIRNAMPSTERAGANFQQVMERARNANIDTSQADEIAQRALELSQRGSSLPKVFSNYIRNRRESGGMPMTYEVGRDFASNAGALSTKEITAMNAKMQGQVGKFADALKQANRTAAQRHGVGDIYDSAMKEYAQAKRLADALAATKKFAKKAAPIAGAGYLGTELIRRGLD